MGLVHFKKLTALPWRAGVKCPPHCHARGRELAQDPYSLPVNKCVVHLPEGMLVQARALLHISGAMEAQ